MKRLRVFMSERCFYQLDIDVEDDASDEDIEAAAEEAFCQGEYREYGQDDRSVDSWEDAF